MKVHLRTQGKNKKKVPELKAINGFIKMLSGVQTEGVPVEDVNVEVEIEGVLKVDYVGQLHTTQQTIPQHAQYTSLNAHHSMVLNKLMNSKRHIKLNSKPVYDKDGASISLDKPVRLDEA
ncbi:hypothetical protein L1887_15241 [Cichorium endivia]|nr:hypothetical protein L1887_15241 [Cichorium endivia]